MTILYRLLAIIFCTVAPPSWASEPLQLQASQLKALGIETIIAGSEQNTHGGGLPARVIVPTEQMRIVSAPVAGMIEMLAVAPGSSVKRGQVLAHLSSPQALELQRDALQSSSLAALQQQNLKRDEQLFAEGLIAESRLQATRSAANQADAQASERRQGLALAGVLSGKLGGPLVLTSPLDGVVLEQNVELGQRLDASAPIYHIAKLSPLWLEIQAPLAIASEQKIGAQVKLSDSGNKGISGKLITIGRAVDAASQTVLLRAAVSAGAEKLYPGQVLTVELAPPSGPQQSLPAAALVREQGKILAFVQTTGNDKVYRFEPRLVRVISQGGDSVIVDGITAGERVVVKGISGLKAMLTGVGQ